MPSPGSTPSTTEVRIPPARTLSHSRLRSYLLPALPAPTRRASAYDQSALTQNQFPRPGRGRPHPPVPRPQCANEAACRFTATAPHPIQLLSPVVATRRRLTNCPAGRHCIPSAAPARRCHRISSFAQSAAPPGDTRLLGIAPPTNVPLRGYGPSGSAKRTSPSICHSGSTRPTRSAVLVAQKAARGHNLELDPRSRVDDVVMPGASEAPINRLTHSTSPADPTSYRRHPGVGCWR